MKLFRELKDKRRNVRLDTCKLCMTGYLEDRVTIWKNAKFLG